mgnify:CR=1 FL=1
MIPFLFRKFLQSKIQTKLRLMSLSLTPTAEETISEPSEYEVMRSNAIAKKEPCYSNQIGKGSQLYEANNGRLYE